MSSTMKLDSMPTEIHLAIFHHLDYESLLKLSATNRYFYQLRINNRPIVAEASLDLIKRHMSAGDVCPAPSSLLYIGSFFQCYKCLEIVQYPDFKKDDGNLRKPADKDDLIGRESGWLRRCKTCSTSAVP